MAMGVLVRLARRVRVFMPMVMSVLMTVAVPMIVRMHVDHPVGMLV